MKLMTIREQIADVAKRWLAQYPRHRGDVDKARIGDALSALDPATATADDVAAIIGNTSWVQPATCNECEQASEAIVRLGEEPDYESRTAMVCRSCLMRAVALVNSTEPAKDASSASEPHKTEGA